MFSVSNGLYFLTLPLVSVMHVIYRKIRHARYLYIKRNVEKVSGARYTSGARYLSKNTVIISVSSTFIIYTQGYMFRPISRSFAGLHSKLSHWRCVHIGIPICSH